MNNFIKDLSDFLIDFTDFLEGNKFISPINKKKISIDYSSNNKQGDLATNFYLIVKRKIINENFNIEKELNDRIQSIGFIDHFIVSKILSNLIDLGHFHISKNLEFSKEKNIN